MECVYDLELSVSGEHEASKEVALVYIERTNLGRRWDAVELGVLDTW